MFAKQDELEAIFRRLQEALKDLKFMPPVTHVYNPLTYAEDPFSQYLKRYLCGPPRRVLLLGMNPGPWGMAQTGVPFGEVTAVCKWLDIKGVVGQPKHPHPARPVTGFNCQRKEVSGQRLWSLFSESYPNPDDFAQNFVIINYCPLVFMEKSGKNRTPDRLPRPEREALFTACDQALKKLIEVLEPKRAIGIGKFATARLEEVRAAAGLQLPIEGILHPSPANPKANAGWAQHVRPVIGL